MKNCDEGVNVIFFKQMYQLRTDVYKICIKITFATVELANPIV